MIKATPAAAGAHTLRKYPAAFEILYLCGDARTSLELENIIQRQAITSSEAFRLRCHIHERLISRRSSDDKIAQTPFILREGTDMTVFLSIHPSFLPSLLPSFDVVKT